MNVERLHLIARELHGDFERTNLVGHLTELADALQDLSGSPADVATQQRVSTAREALRAAVRESGTDKWPPAWLATLDELGIAGVVGSAILDRVELAMAANEITPATAAAAVRAIAGEATALDASLSTMLKVFVTFKIETEELEVGDSEVSVSIPRAEVSERLVDLGREFEMLNKILGVFVELATGSREPMRVRTIASSDYGVYLETGVQVGALIAISVEYLLNTYKTILEIRTHRQALADQGFDNELVAIDERVNRIMAEKIQEYVDRAIAERYAVREGRVNELAVELVHSLSAIANRIDRGYNFDVRAPEGSAEDEAADSAIQEATQRIVNASPNLKYINRSGEAILSLPEGSNGGASGEDASG